MKGKLLKHIFTFCIVGFCPSIFSFAQTYNFRNTDVADGLPQSYVYTVRQGPSGYLWIGTGEGLVRYDGRKFKTLTVKDGLAENFVYSSYSFQGTVWFGHFQGGITKREKGIMHKLPTPGQLSSPVEGFFGDFEKNVWAVTKNDGLVCILANSDSMLFFKSEFESLMLYAVVRERGGDVLVASSEGVLRFGFEGKSLQLKGFIHGTEYVSVSGLQPSLTGNWFYVTVDESGIFRLNPGEDEMKKIEIAGEHPFPSKPSFFYEDTASGSVWVGSMGEGLFEYILVSDTLLPKARYTKANGLSNDYVRSFEIDKDKGIWIGTFGNGLDKLYNRNFVLFNRNDGIPDDNVLSVHNSTAGKIFIGTMRGFAGLEYDRYGNLTVKNYSFPESIKTKKINSIYEGSNGAVYLAIENEGVWKMSASGVVTPWYIGGSSLSSTVNCITGNDRGDFWLATSEGAVLYTAADKQFRRFSMADGLSHNHIRSVFIDSRGDVWFATHGSGMSKYSGGTFVTYQSPNQGVGIDINCFAEDEEGNLWVGTYGQGVFKFNGNEFVAKFDKKEGLGSNYCYVITIDKNAVWIGHKSGITKIVNYGSKAARAVFMSEELLGAESNLGAVCRDKFQHIWLGTNKGLIRFESTASESAGVLPVTHITGVQLFYNDIDWSKHVDEYQGGLLPANARFKHDQNHFTFNYVGISFKKAEAVTYRYKMEGLDSEWSRETYETFATYTALPPGNYRFVVTAKVQGGDWAPVSEVFEFTVLPPFWKTWWFFVIVLIASVNLLLLVIKLRTDVLKGRNKRLEEEKVRLQSEIERRTKIQNELQKREQELKLVNEELNTFLYKSSHDLRGPLSTISGLTNVALMEVEDKEIANYFKMIGTTAQKLDGILLSLIHITEIKNGVVLPEKIDFNEIIAEVMKQLGRKYKLGDYLISINNKCKKSFYSDNSMIKFTYYNLMENALKYHSKHPIISVDVLDSDEGIIMTIKDNGIGFPKEKLKLAFSMFFKGTSMDAGSGLGLYIVKNAVDKMYGTVYLSGEEGVGTQVEVSLPSLLK